MEMHRGFRKIRVVAAWMFMFIMLLSSAVAETSAETRTPLDYSDSQNWVYCGAEDGETAVDVFFIAPSAFGGKEGSYLMDLSNEKGRANFIGTVNMEKGIYDQGTRFYAPFYREAGYNVYTLPEEDAEPLKQSAYADVKNAFTYYMDHLNSGRPFILAGFSEGADMAIRLMKDCFGEETLRKQLIVCYAIGWRLTEEETEEWPQLRPAQGETDTGVIITFTTEAEEVPESAFIPAGMKTLSINPLSWKTDTETAGKELNLGACFTDYEGAITEEIPALTGAYLDAERGTLKVTDIDPEAYSATLSILEPGVYHLYDYQFFYRNLQENVQNRIQAYLQPAGNQSTSRTIPKVILDTDMAYLNDDAIAMFMLAQADKAGMLEFLGVTTAGGNVFVPEATTAALRQLELIGREDIPVYQGTDEPLDGFRDMRVEGRLYGIPYYCGAYWDFEKNDFTDLTERSTDYLHLREEPIHGYAHTPAQEETAWDFILRTVHEFPGEVTIMTVGAATNIALALQKDPTLADDAAGIIYMGGDIDCPGDATPAAEMNWYYDPEAIRQCLAANWKSQLIVPDDLARQIQLTPEIYERLEKANQNLITKYILSNPRTFDMEGANYVWDVVVPAVFLKPELMVKTEERYITVDTTPGINSGRAVSWPQHWLNNMETGVGFPEGVNKAVILFSIDAEAFWDYYVELLSY